jgi:hypothetical protein
MLAPTAAAPCRTCWCALCNLLTQQVSNRNVHQVVLQKSNTHSSSTQPHVTNRTQLQNSGLLQCWVWSLLVGTVVAAQTWLGWVARLAPATAAGVCCVRPAPSSRSVHTVCLCLLQVHQQSSHEGASWSPQLSLPALSSNGGSNSSISSRAPHSSQLHTASCSGAVITAA